MNGDEQFVTCIEDLYRSVDSFMKDPDLWRAAVGNSPKYFLHYVKGDRHLFGLSKFCAFKNRTLQEYVDELHGTTDGGTTQRHISVLTQRPWVPLEGTEPEIRKVFLDWFFGFFPPSYAESRLHLITLPKRQ